MTGKDVVLLGLRRRTAGLAPVSEIVANFIEGFSGTSKTQIFQAVLETGLIDLSSAIYSM